MNIVRAKEEIIHTIRAYTRKNKDGSYEIPALRQRPILMIGPPGIGKTAIVSQAAKACRVGFVAYTITHHTRQSAVGLPVIKKQSFQGREYEMTEYTMSEIIGSVYLCMEETGVREGILFIDEINCVSETLLPTMLQLLQGKKFGEYKVPEGWIIVTAGNPYVYNRSVRDFDMVTLDRVKRIEIEPDYPSFKAYARENRLHASILFYLECHKDRFYYTKKEGREISFVTARGWEDLSVILYAYEAEGIDIDKELICQYLQCEMVAEEFMNFYLLYKNYREDFEKLMASETLPRKDAGKKLPWEEKCCLIGYGFSLIAGESQSFAEKEKEMRLREKRTGLFLNWLGRASEGAGEAKTRRYLEEQKNALEIKKKAKLLSEEDVKKEQKEIFLLEEVCCFCLAGHAVEKEDFERLSGSFLEDEKKELEKDERELSAKIHRILAAFFELFKDSFGEYLQLLEALSQHEATLLFLNRHPDELFGPYMARLLLADEEEALKEDLRKADAGNL